MVTSEFHHKMSSSRNIEHTSGIFHVRRQNSQLGIEDREEANHEDTDAERIEGSSEARESISYSAILYSLLVFAVSFASIATQTLIPLRDNFLNQNIGGRL